MKNKAFTIIELLLVLAIIILLAGLLLPVLIQARNKARQVQCMSNMRQVGMAVQMYADDHDGSPPIGAYNTPSPSVAVVDQLSPAFQTQAGMVYRVDWRDALLGMQYLGGRRVLVCPMAASRDPRFSYGSNRWVLGWEWSAPLYSIPLPAMTALVSEKRATDWVIWLPNESQNNPYYFPMDPRHSGAVNVLFCDGHVRSVAIGEAIQGVEIRWRWQP